MAFHRRKSETGRKARRIPKKNNLLVMAVYEECQLCASIAAPVACSNCYTLLCAECIESFDGKPVCCCCREELETPKRLAKVLMFPASHARCRA